MGCKGAFLNDQGADGRARIQVNLIAPSIMNTPVPGNLKALFVPKGFLIGDPKDVAEPIVKMRCGRWYMWSCHFLSELRWTSDLRDDSESSDGAMEIKKLLPIGRQESCRVLLFALKLKSFVALYAKEAVAPKKKKGNSSHAFSHTIIGGAF